MKVVFHQLTGWLNANIMLLRHVQSLITVLFIWLDLKVTGSVTTKLRAKYRPSALLIFELGTFPFIANMLSYQLFVQTSIEVWYFTQKKSVLNWILINSMFWRVYPEILKVYYTVTIISMWPTFLSCYVNNFFFSAINFKPI